MRNHYPLAVIAGNWHQFRMYCRDNNIGPQDAVYVESKQAIAGYRFREVITIGTYFTRDDWRELMDYAQACPDPRRQEQQ